jgi:hypothetical protein
VTMKNVVFRDVTPYSFYNNRRFGGTYRLHHQGEGNVRATKYVSRSLSLSTLMMEAICSSRTSILTRVTRRHSPHDAILHIPSYISPFLFLDAVQKANESTRHFTSFNGWFTAEHFSML